MRIAIDARELEGRATGAGRYLAALLAEWKTLPEAAGHEFVLCRPGARRGTAWEQWTLPGLVRRTGAQVLFAPAYTAPLRSPVPVVLTIHDVSFSAHPEWFSAREGFRRRTLARASARRAAHVLTISQFSKAEIVRHLRVPADKVEVIYCGITPLAASSSSAVEPRVLFVGSVFNRRHVPELIEGFARVAARRPDARLDIVGDNRTRPHQDLEAVVSRCGCAGGVALHAYVPDAELARLYASARAFAFLSDYEGFGFTPLEALSAGVPPVVLDSPVAREVYGDAAIYVRSPEPAAIAAALDTVLFDEAARARVLAAAPAVLARFSWRDAAARTLQALIAHGA